MKMPGNYYFTKLSFQLYVCRTSPKKYDFVCFQVHHTFITISWKYILPDAVFFPTYEKHHKAHPNAKEHHILCHENVDVVKSSNDLLVLCVSHVHTFGSKWPWLGLVVCHVIFVLAKRPNLIIEILFLNSRVWKLKPSLLWIPRYFEEGYLWCMFPLVIGTFETSYGILVVENWSSVFLYIASFVRSIFFGNLIGKIKCWQCLFPH